VPTWRPAHSKQPTQSIFAGTTPLTEANDAPDRTEAGVAQLGEKSVEPSRSVSRTTSGRSKRSQGRSAERPPGTRTVAHDGADMMHQIGNRLRQLRLERNLTLGEAARAAGLSASFLGMLERGTTAVSVSRLIALADAYEVNVADLLANGREVRSEFVRASEGYVAPTDSDDVIVTYLSSASWTMQPFLVRLAPGSHLDSMAHGSEEFVHCVSGAPTIIVDDVDEYAMSPGDTLFLHSGTKHTYLNDTRAVAELVGAVRRAHPRTWSDPSIGRRP